MVVLATNEIEGAEIFAIYGSNAVDISNRPRLQIVYSRKK
jgi:hypothetical protein